MEERERVKRAFGRLRTKVMIPIGLCMILLLPMAAHAMSVINCHCFTDRSYESARPVAADPYFLASVQNSFFAVVFNTDKKTIVKKKQQGTSSDDLWIAYWVASGSGASPDSLIQAKLKSRSWKDVLASSQLVTKESGSRFSNALNANMSNTHLAAAVLDEIVLRHKILSDKELSAIRQAGASNQELIIAAVIASRTKQSAGQIYLDVKKGPKSWGYLLKVANIDVKNIHQDIAAILKLNPS